MERWPRLTLFFKPTLTSNEVLQCGITQLHLSCKQELSRVLALPSTTSISQSVHYPWANKFALGQILQKPSRIMKIIMVVAPNILKNLYFQVIFHSGFWGTSGRASFKCHSGYWQFGSMFKLSYGNNLSMIYLPLNINNWPSHNHDIFNFD